MLVLFQTNDLGGGLLYFAVFLAMLYIATGRWAFVAVGVALFSLGAYGLYHVVPHVEERVTIWLHPWSRSRRRPGTSSSSRSTPISGGGLFGAGLGRGVLLTPEGSTYIPFLQTDFIYSAIAQELGLAGAAAVILLYIVSVYRGFRIAMLARRRLLQAARRRTDGRGRRAGVHHHRRGHGPHPADRDHACRSSPTAARASSPTSSSLWLLLMVSNRVNQGGAAMNPQIRGSSSFSAFLFVASSRRRRTGSGAPPTSRRAGQPDADRPAAEIKRGLIFAADGRPARARTGAQGGGRTLVAPALPAERCSPPTSVGYSTIGRSRTGLEKSMNDFLTGSNANLSTVVNRPVDKLRGLTRRGTTSS